MGYMLQVLPLLSGFRSKYPDASIDLLISETYEPLLKGNPNVDRIITLPIDDLRKNINKKHGYKRSRLVINGLLETLLRKKYDLIVNRQFSRFEMTLVGALESTTKLGPYYKINNSQTPFLKELWESLQDEQVGDEVSLVTDEQTTNHIWNIIHNRKEYKHNLVDAGLDMVQIRDSHYFRLPVDQANRKWAEDLFQSAGISSDRPVVGVQAGAGVKFRQLEQSALVKALNRWSELHQGRILFFGTKDERERIHSIIDTLDKPEIVLNLAGRTSLTGLAACLEKVNFLLCPDTGTMHLAAAVNTPTVSLFFGAAFPWETGPYGQGHLTLSPELSCRPCKAPRLCPIEGFCKTMITPTSILKALELAFSLSINKLSEEKEKIILSWVGENARYYLDRRVEVLFSGLNPIDQPTKLIDLISSRKDNHQINEIAAVKREPLLV